MSESENNAQNSEESEETMAGEPGNAIAEAKIEAEKARSEILYLRAEFENFKRQTIKERSDLRKYGSERLAVDLLNVLDIFETALSSEVNSENLANFKKGIEMTASELRIVLGRHGIEEIPAKGKPFDPSMHEALSSQETADVPPGTVTQVFKKPYKLHDRVIRPGQVVVAKPKA
jgi:molecular chaperone GrpE